MKAEKSRENLLHSFYLKLSTLAHTTRNKFDFSQKSLSFEINKILITFKYDNQLTSNQAKNSGLILVIRKPAEYFSMEFI